MALMQKKYKKLVRELMYVYSELEYMQDALAEAHIDFEIYYRRYCEENHIPIAELNKKNSEKIKSIYPDKKPETDNEGIIKAGQAPPIPDKKIHKVFTKMYRMVTSKIHPDKFSGREITPEINHKIEMFKDATKSYGDRNWGKFLEICEKLDILPTRYDGISSVIRDEISDINKKIMSNKKMYSWRLYECEGNDNCKNKVIEDFLLQLFNYKVKHIRI